MAIKINPLSLQEVLQLCQSKAALVIQERVPIFTTIQSLSLNKYVGPTEIKPLCLHAVSPLPLENWNLETLSPTDSKTICCWRSANQTLSLIYDEKRLRQGQLEKQDNEFDIPPIRPEKVYIQWNKDPRNLTPYISGKEGEEELYLFEPGINQKQLLCVKLQKESWPEEQCKDIKNALQDLLKASPTNNLTLQGAKTLEHCCHAVCRIVMNGAQTEKVDFWGTGFVIGNRLVMTNHHVLDTEDKCRNSQAEFFINQKKVVVKFKPEELLITSQAPKGVGPNQLNLGGLDFTIVAIEDHPDLKEVFTHIISLNEFDNPQGNGSINIIHHPSGKEKVVGSAQSFNHRVVKVDQFYFTYGADTEPGSSGSPVFDHSWKLLGLHRQTEGGNPSTDKVAIKIGAIYHQLFTTYEKGFTISNLARIQQPQFHPLLNEGISAGNQPLPMSNFKFGSTDENTYGNVNVVGSFNPQGPKSLTLEEIRGATEAALKIHQPAPAQNDKKAPAQNDKKNTFTSMGNTKKTTFTGTLNIGGDWNG